MWMTTLAAVLLLQAPPPQAELRTVTVAVTDAKGAPVGGLVSDDVVVLENGVARDVAKVAPDDRPLSVVILVDTSQAAGPAYRLNIVEALVSLVRKLPEGSRYALWTTGDRPTRLVEFTDDPTAAGKALKRIAPQGGNTLLDALVEASRDLKEQEGRRSAVVVVSGMGTEFSNYDRRQAVELAKKSGATFLAVLYQEGPVAFDDRQVYEYVLSHLCEETGGVLESPLSSMGVASALDKLAADLASRYRVVYASLPEIKGAKLEVKVARPGVRVRVTAPLGKP